MLRLLVPLLCALFAGPALAQDLTIHDEWLVEPAAGTFTENGVGSPTVAYDPAQDLWVMYFESRVADADTDCRDGRWVIGRATSPDGLSWTVDPDPVIEPGDGTYYDCVLAHPSVLFDGDTWHLWFKAHQENTVCSGGGTAPPWGCAAITGVGYASSSDGIDFTVTAEPIINLSFFGFPTVTKLDGVLRMLLAYSNEANNIFQLWTSVSADDGATWSAPEVVVRPGISDWITDEIYNPSVTCRSERPFPLVLWAGGRDTEPAPGGGVTLTAAGLGRAFSDDGVDWPWDEDNPYVLWDLDPEMGDPDRDWRHWDSVRIDDDYLLFFSQRNDEGRNRVGLATTYASSLTSFDEGAISNRICTLADDTGIVDSGIDSGDTGTPPADDSGDPADDTGETGATGTTDTPDDGPKDDGGCGCTQGTSPAGGLVLLGLVALRRRRH